MAAVNPLGRRTTSVYDKVGRNVAAVDPLGSRTTSVYDTAGQGVAKIDPFGKLEYSTRFHAMVTSPKPPYQFCSGCWNISGTSTSSWFFIASFTFVRFFIGLPFTFSCR